jgi:hypothetical protein
LSSTSNVTQTTSLFRLPNAEIAEAEDMEGESMVYPKLYTLCNTYLNNEIWVHVGMEEIDTVC